MHLGLKGLLAFVFMLHADAADDDGAPAAIAAASNAALPFALFAVVVADAVVAPLATARLLLAVRANYIAPVRDV